MVCARSASIKIRRRAFAKSCGSCADTRKALSLSIAISGTPPTFVATTGTPAAIASSKTFGDPQLTLEDLLLFIRNAPRSSNRVVANNDAIWSHSRARELFGKSVAHRDDSRRGGK